VLNVTRFPDEDEGHFRYCRIAIDDEDTQSLYMSLLKAFELLDAALVWCHALLFPQATFRARARPACKPHGIQCFWDNYSCENEQRGQEYLTLLASLVGVAEAPEGDGDSNSSVYAANDEVVDASKCNELVHCEYGISRSASFMVGYLMYITLASSEQALALVKGKRPVVDPNSGFLKQLLEYEQDLRK
jgi:hypothetical protein